MELIVEIKTGPGVGRKLVLRPGKIIQVGRTSWADLSVPDPTMSGMHFAIECGTDTCRLRDLKSTNGTLVNGTAAAETVLQDGDHIIAGRTEFVVYRGELDAVPVPTVPLEELQKSGAIRTPNEKPQEPQDLLQILRNTPDPLFAVVDAARDPINVLTLLNGCGEEYQSLFEGTQGERLAAAAPYLIRLPSQSPSLETLVRKGWGNSWGVYLTCDRPFQEVRKHLRRFLTVETDDRKTLYFRFYDPRVLRVFLPTCTPQQAAEFFGPISCYWAENEEARSLLKFRYNHQGARQEALALTVAGG